MKGVTSVPAMDRRQDDDLAREHADPHAGGIPALFVDRERIVRSAAFRRLQFKTQVFIATEGDHHRTRLAHTLEVAHLARRIARVLGANEELAEVVALAHDLGHPPFGHAGERALDACLGAWGGFEHNVHSLRVVEYLEHPYPEFRGLNLTRVVRECLAKHETRFDRPGGHMLGNGRPAPLEGQVVALADELAYGLHDLLDAVFAGLLNVDDLLALPLWRSAYRGPRAEPGNDEWRGHLRPAIDRIQNELIDDLVRHTKARLRLTTKEGNGQGVRGDAHSTRDVELRLSRRLRTRWSEFAAFVGQHVYRHRRVRAMDEEAARTVSAVFRRFVTRPSELPKRFEQRIAADGVERVVADYVAGMTDRFCRQEFQRIVQRTGQSSTISVE